MKKYIYPIFGTAYEVELVFNTYGKDGPTALQLYGQEVGNNKGYRELISTVSVNIPDDSLFVEASKNPNFIAVKDYSEQDGMANWLLDNGILNPDTAVGPMFSGYELIVGWELSAEVIRLREEQFTE